jgi:hypothetical protein
MVVALHAKHFGQELVSFFFAVADRWEGITNSATVQKHRDAQCSRMLTTRKKRRNCKQRKRKAKNRTESITVYSPERDDTSLGHRDKERYNNKFSMKKSELLLQTFPTSPVSDGDS